MKIQKQIKQIVKTAYNRVTKMTNREILKRLVIKGTKILRNTYYKDFKENEEIDASTMKIINNARRLFSNPSLFLETLTEVTGKKFPALNEEEIQLTFFAMVVPVSNPNGHSYTIGEPVLTVPNNSICYMVNGNQGNSITKRQYALRPATLKQIDTFLTGFPEDKVTLLAEYYYIERL